MIRSVSRADEHLDEVRAVLAEPDQSPSSAPDLDAAESGGEIGESEADARVAAEEVIQATKDYLVRRWSGTRQQFEEVVAAVFRALGYTATTQQGTRDLGVDAIAHADPLDSFEWDISACGYLHQLAFHRAPLARVGGVTAVSFRRRSSD